MKTRLVRELVGEGVLRVEDGNHGNDRPRPDEFVQDGVAYVRAADMTQGWVDFGSTGKINSHARQRIRKGVGAPGDVLLSHKGTVGRVAVAPLDSPEFVCSPQTTFWRSQDPSVLDQRFLGYLLLSPEFQEKLRRLAGQTDMAPYVSLTDQRSMELALPEITQQKAIAEVLGALDDKIVNIGLAVTTSESLMCSLASASDSRIPVSDLVTRTQRVVIDPSSIESTVSHYSLPAFDNSCTPELVKGGSIKSSKYLLTGAAVLVSKLNPRIPRVWNIPYLPEHPAVTSTEFVILEPSHVAVSVLWACICQPDVMEQLQSKVAGTSGSHQRAKPGGVMSLLVRDPRLLPPQVLDALEALGAHANALRRQRVLLGLCRDELLPLLMSGKITVRDAERTVSDVV
ncbi:MAG: restriction endonuclease subunit S [Kineosporiaceae bacterium]|nr:restriction endonuclease subunit S [Kineosporiaceae bacterium]